MLVYNPEAVVPHGIGLMAFVFFFLNSYSHGYSDGNFFKNFTAVDTATARRGYSDGLAWIQRRPGVDTETARCGYSDSVVI